MNLKTLSNGSRLFDFSDCKIRNIFLIKQELKENFSQIFFVVLEIIKNTNNELENIFGTFSLDNTANGIM